jgi:hypothetical protein
MNRGHGKSRQYITLTFITLMLYAIISMWYSFKYIDLGYLILITIGFIRFLRVKEFN